MGLILKHVEKTKSGRWQYRRRVPKEVAEVIDKREFKRVLGDTEREALKVYPQFHAEVERAIEKAKGLVSQDTAATRGEVTDREAYTAALARVEQMGADGLSLPTREAIIEHIANRYAQDPETLDPIDATDVDRHTINLLRNGASTAKEPEVTLEDVKKLYLRHQRGVDPSDTGDKNVQEVNRIVGHVKDALGRDPVLIDLTRAEARDALSHMLSRVKADGKRISHTSVARELNTLKAIINFAAAEMVLPGTFQNPFNRLSVPTPKGADPEGQKVLPLPANILAATRKRILSHASIPELPLIWRLLEGTGCRLSEVRGLRVEDVTLEGETPNIRVAWHEDRRVKTKASFRHVPLVGDALDAAKEAVKAAGDNRLLFARYVTPKGGTSLSQILMKHLRTQTDDRKHVINSLRHNMKDNLMLAEVSSLDQNLILGHALGGVGDRVYGGTPAKLKVTARAMKKALGVDQ